MALKCFWASRSAATGRYKVQLFLNWKSRTTKPQDLLYVQLAGVKKESHEHKPFMFKTVLRAKLESLYLGNG